MACGWGTWGRRTILDFPDAGLEIVKRQARDCVLETVEIHSEGAKRLDSLQ